MKPWARFIHSSKNKIIKTLICCVVVFLSLTPKIGSDCGPSNFSFEGYSFINPRIANVDSAYINYFMNFEELYKTFGAAEEVKEKSNLEEWQDRFCGLVEIEELRQIIYKTSIRDLLSLGTAVKSENIPIEPAFRKNGFAQHLKSQQCEETIDYLVFAKRCEPHVTYSGGWEAPRRDVSEMEELIRKGRKALLKSKSHYIRLRYAYQVIRLAHYTKDYDYTLELYDKLMPRIDKTESILNDWIEGHRAGALRSKGETVEAAYLFLKIFLNSKSRRSSAYQSFYIKNDEQWRACYLKCEDDKERAGLYALRASADESKAAEEMEKIYELDPNNRFLEMLLVKEIKKIERDFLGLEFNDRRKRNKTFHKIPRKKGGDYLTRLLKLVNRIINDDTAKRRNFWLMARGYLQYLGGDLYDAGQTFTDLRPLVNNKILEEQLAAFSLALRVHGFETMDEDNEEEIFETMLNDPIYKKYPSFPDFINDRISQLYANDGHPGLAFRCHHTMLELKYHPQEEILNDLLAICAKEKRTNLEEAMVIDKDGVNLQYVLMDIKGTHLMSEGKLEAALEVFRKIPVEEKDKWQFNPFYERLYDCIDDCPLPDSMDYYNKEEIIREIFELEYKAKSDFERGAQCYYDLGQAYYNMSYFGHSWQALDFFRSGSNNYYDKDNVYPLYGAPYGNDEQVELGKALEMFVKSRDLAHQYQKLINNNESLVTRYRELAARATFMAARCERQMYFMSPDSEQSHFSIFIPQVPDGYNTNYNLLKTEYNDTRFYDQVITECKYFRAYALK